ncbi:hypothetical protein V8D89_001182 [Ganoderma adspersum]
MDSGHSITTQSSPSLIWVTVIHPKVSCTPNGMACFTVEGSDASSSYVRESPTAPGSSRTLPQLSSSVVIAHECGRVCYPGMSTTIPPVVVTSQSARSSDSRACAPGTPVTREMSSSARPGVQARHVRRYQGRKAYISRTLRTLLSWGACCKGEGDCAVGGIVELVLRERQLRHPRLVTSTAVTMVGAGWSEHLSRADVVWSTVNLRQRRSSTGGRTGVDGDPLHRTSTRWYPQSASRRR